MGYDITFHPVSLQELQTYVFDVIDDPRLLDARLRTLCPNAEDRESLRELYAQLFRALEADEKEDDEETVHPGPLAVHHGQLLGRRIHPARVGGDPGGTTNNRGFYGVFGGTGPQGVTSATEGAYWQNTYDPEAEWGPMFHDVRHNFIFSASYELPFGKGANTAPTGRGSRTRSSAAGRWAGFSSPAPACP